VITISVSSTAQPESITLVEAQRLPADPSESVEAKAKAAALDQSPPTGTPLSRVVGKLGFPSLGAAAEDLPITRRVKEGHRTGGLKLMSACHTAAMGAVYRIVLS
jgi:hypothetical protein